MMTTMSSAQNAPKKLFPTSETECLRPLGYWRFTAIKYVTNKKPIPRTTPGIAPATNKSPMEILARVPMMIIGREGGSIGPTVDEIEVTAAEKPEPYPCFFIAGIMTEPILAVSDNAVPDMPPNPRDDATLVRASPPRICPTRAFAKSMMRFVIPPAFIRLPARMKAGIASMTKESNPANIVWGMTVTGTPAIKRYAKAEKPKLKAIGTPAAIQNRKIPTTSKDIINHPPHFLVHFSGNGQLYKRLNKRKVILQVLESKHIYRPYLRQGSVRRNPLQDLQTVYHI